MKKPSSTRPRYKTNIVYDCLFADGSRFRCLVGARGRFVSAVTFDYREADLTLIDRFIVYARSEVEQLLPLIRQWSELAVGTSVVHGDEATAATLRDEGVRALVRNLIIRSLLSAAAIDEVERASEIVDCICGEPAVPGRQLRIA